jgi:hypothetical protein
MGYGKWSVRWPDFPWRFFVYPLIACQSLRFRTAGDISCLLPNQNVFHRTMKKRTPILDSSWRWEHGWDWKFPTVAELDNQLKLKACSIESICNGLADKRMHLDLTNRHLKHFEHVQ